MAVPLKVWVTFAVTFTFSVVYSPPTFRDLHPSRTTSVALLDDNENDVLNLLRKRRETIVGHGCPMGKIWYYTKCKSSKELEYYDTPSTTETGTVYTTLEKDKHVESMQTDVNLSVMPPATSNVTTKLSTVMNEPRVSATVPTPIVTEPNFNVKPLETVEKPRLSDTESNSLLTTLTAKVVTPNFNVIDPRSAMATSNKIGTDLSSVRTEPTFATVLINTTTAAPSQVKTEPHLRGTKPYQMEVTSAMVPRAMVPTRPAVKQLKTVIELNNVTEATPFMTVEQNSFEAESVPAVAKQKHTVTSPKPFVTDPRSATSVSTTAAADVTLSTTISTPVVVGTRPAATKTKGIVTDSLYLTTDPTPTVAETVPARTETNSESVSETTSLPTRFTVTESASSSTTVKSKGIFGTHILYTFISALKELTWKYVLLLVGSSVVYLCVLLYKKFTQGYYEEEVVGRKTVVAALISDESA